MIEREVGLLTRQFLTEIIFCAIGLHCFETSLLNYSHTCEVGAQETYNQISLFREHLRIDA